MNSFKKPRPSCAKAEERYKIIIVGLGLIGGSLAMALQGFRNAHLSGVDIDAATLEKALAAEAVDEASLEIPPGIREADLVILCVSPRHIPEMVKKNLPLLKPGAVMTDVCGAKTHLYEEIEGLWPADADYIGIHPMAGKEVGGFDNAEKGLFRDTGFLITPLRHTKAETIALMEELAAYIGATKIARATAELHDDIIAYTSDLMHISATALCMEPHLEMNRAYTAGAFRDCTRIANIDAALWTELLLYNDEKILPHLQAYIRNLEAFRQALEKRDENKLFSLLEQGGKQKKEMLKK